MIGGMEEDELGGPVHFYSKLWIFHGWRLNVYGVGDEGATKSQELGR